jgi:tRNA G10  N-methylase Trm11
MKYLFILGRNIELSKQEVLAYFEKEGNPVLNYLIKKNGMLIEIENQIDFSVIKNFGGVISIGEVIAFSKGLEIKNKLEKEMIYKGKENKLNYVLWNFSESHSEVLNYLKKRFKEEKIKATEKHLNDGIEMQDESEIYIPSSKLLDEEYFIFQEEENEYFGRIVSRADYENIEKRDMEKPIRRESLAISPRLAKIMINLSKLKEGEKMFDPFCGIGVFLEEALLQKIKVIGVDIDSAAVEGAKENLKWFGFDENDYSLINFDSKKVNLPEIDGIVTEPDLGETLKKIPTRGKAEKTLKEFEKLIVQVINNSKNKNSGRIVFTSPLIRIGKKRLDCNIKNICERTGYKEIVPGIEEYRKKQVVGRKIFILEKI